METRIAYRTCPLCEATCGLEITVHEASGGLTIGRIRGDRDDVFSKGYICPKGSTLGYLHDDPDRLRKPVVKRDGTFVEVEWREAFATIEAGLLPLLTEHGRDACAVYLGNPTAHSLGPMLYFRTLLTALGTSNRFSASTVDQRPKEMSAAMMFGSVTVPVPDLDRTDFLLILGANPYASNGSLCTAPDFPGRLERIQERGGTVIVVDPRRSETAAKADQHIAIRPGTDAHLLAAIANTLITEGLARPGRLAEHSNGLADVAAALARVHARLGGRHLRPRRRGDPHAGDRTRRRAVGGRLRSDRHVHSRVRHAGVVAGRPGQPLDRQPRPGGGALFPMGAVGQASTKGRPGIGRGQTFGRVTTRVAERPETFGEFPVAAMAEEIETPGDGQIRALMTLGGNPVSSNPNSVRLDAALASLEFMVSVDIRTSTRPLATPR